MTQRHPPGPRRRAARAAWYFNLACSDREVPESDMIHRAGRDPGPPAAARLLLSPARGCESDSSGAAPGVPSPCWQPGRGDGVSGAPPPAEPGAAAAIIIIRIGVSDSDQYYYVTSHVILRLLIAAESNTSVASTSDYYSVSTVRRQ